jgi:hypothetical protein
MIFAPGTLSKFHLKQQGQTYFGQALDISNSIYSLVQEKPGGCLYPE